LGETASKALGGAAGGAAANAAQGIVTGNLDLGDVAKAALASGVASGIKSALSPTPLPPGQSGPPAPSTVATGIAALDKYLPSVAANTAGAVAGGKDLGDALTGNIVGAAGNYLVNEASGLLPSSGNDTLDKLIKYLGGTYASKELAELFAPSPSTPTRPSGNTTAQPAAPKAPTTALVTPPKTSGPSVNAGTGTGTGTGVGTGVGTGTGTGVGVGTGVGTGTAASGNPNNLLNYLSLASMLGGGNATQTSQPPELANIKPMDLSWLTPTATKLYSGASNLSLPYKSQRS
jgi:hypothetical protein